MNSGKMCALASLLGGWWKQKRKVSTNLLGLFSSFFWNFTSDPSLLTDFKAVPRFGLLWIRFFQNIIPWTPSFFPSLFLNFVFSNPKQSEFQSCWNNKRKCVLTLIPLIKGYFFKNKMPYARYAYQKSLGHFRFNRHF